jgi:hypothetical protein
MPTRIRTGKRSSRLGGLSEVAYRYFGDGPFFEAERFEQQTSPEERGEIWRAHRAAIIERWRVENPANIDLGTWGEYLEGAAYAD